MLVFSLDRSQDIHYSTSYHHQIKQPLLLHQLVLDLLKNDIGKLVPRK